VKAQVRIRIAPFPREQRNGKAENEKLTVEEIAKFPIHGCLEIANILVV